MSEENKFPLIFWEQTSGFTLLFQEAMKKRETLVRAWKNKYYGDSYIGPVQMHTSEDGDPRCFINEGGSFHTGRFYGIQRRWSADEALSNALKYGSGGWCTLTELEQLISGSGPLLERAMRDCGFRPGKRNPKSWSRIKEGRKELEKERAESSKIYKEQERKEWPIVPPEEADRLNQLWVFHNESAGLNKTYSLKVNKNGCIFVRLEVNPFSAVSAEQLEWLGGLLNSSGHIAREQNGFSLDVKNITLGTQKGIHVKAIKPNGSYVEFVWPTEIPEEKLFPLAEDLALRMGKGLVH